MIKIYILSLFIFSTVAFAGSSNQSDDLTAAVKLASSSLENVNDATVQKYRIRKALILWVEILSKEIFLKKDLPLLLAATPFLNAIPSPWEKWPSTLRNFKEASANLK